MIDQFDLFEPVESDSFEIEVIQSSRRKKTFDAQLEKNKLVIRAPERVSQKELQEAINYFSDKFKKRLEKERLNRVEDLSVVAERLNKKYFAGALKFQSVEYVTHFTSQYGCCDVQKRTIHLSHVLADYPTWVRDYVLVHELAHLIEPNHSPEFWELVNRYPKTERAIGYLMAKDEKIEGID